jgi:nitric oxide reductase large subunit
MAKALEPRREQRPAMSACSIAGITLGALVLGFVLINVPDILRYIRISNM